MAFVTRPTNDLLLTFTDRAGKYSTVRYHVDDGETDPNAGGATDLKTKTAALSDALLTKAEILRYAIEDAPAAAGSGPFDRVSDKAKLIFKDANNVRATLELATIKEDQLLPDGYSIDFGTVEMIALWAALQAVAVTAEGGPFEFWTEGYRKRNKGIKHQ